MMAMKMYRADAAIHFAKLGEEWANSAKATYADCKKRGEHPSWPAHFIACQALELYLKAFLRAKGVEVDELKFKIGHNLVRALAEARQRDFDRLVTLSADDEHVINTLNSHYRDRDFQYQGSGEFTLVPVVLLISLLDRINRPVFGACAQSGFKT
jgi:hypothetical protein